MVAVQDKAATLEDLHCTPGKAELIDGRIERFTSTGLKPGRIARNILFLIAEFVESFGRGEVLADNVGYAVPKLPSGRESFCPDVAYIENADQANEMDFIQGAPTFAVEVRSKDGYGPAAERAMAAKRADYFACGTKAVWHVDSKNECIYAYSIAAPLMKRTFRRGDVADAEPALPGWRVEVDKIFTR